MATIMQLPLSTQEAHALLRVIGAGNDALLRENPPARIGAPAPLDVQTGTWLAERILRLIDEAERAAA